MPEPLDEPIYLLLEDILELYAAIVGGTPAEASDYLRNRSGLEGAVARPASYAHYERADLPMQAAVLAHGLAEGQFFIDGNKRIALVAMLTFLEMNGWRVEASDPQLAEWILDLSEGATPADLAENLRARYGPDLRRARIAAARVTRRAFLLIARQIERPRLLSLETNDAFRWL